MTYCIIAKLFKDLPDVKAGAIFHSISCNEWKQIGVGKEYTNLELYYFHDDEYNNSSIMAEDNITCYHVDDLGDWALFFDFSKGAFVSLEEVKALCIDELSNE